MKASEAMMTRNSPEFRGFADRRMPSPDADPGNRTPAPAAVGGMRAGWPYRWWLPPAGAATGVWAATAAGHLWWGHAVSLAVGLCAVAGAGLLWRPVRSVPGRITLAVTAAGGTIWTTVAVEVGPWNTILLAILGIAVLAGTVVWARLPVIRRRVRDDADARAWPAYATQLGIDAAVLQGIERTTTGRKLLVGLAPGQTWRDIHPETAETVLDVAPGAVTVERDHTSARRVTIHVQDSDPWADGGTFAHPILAELPTLETLARNEGDETTAHPTDTAPASGVLVWRPGSGSIHRPIPIGTRPDGTPAALPLRDADGAKHWLVGGMTGSGKSVFYRNLLTGLARCGDVVIFGIDTAKRGKAFGPWAPVMTRVAATLPEAVDLLETSLAIIENSAAASAAEAANGEGEDNVQPSRTRPQVVVMIDEGADILDVSNSDLTTRDGELRFRAVELCERIGATGRSEAVSLVLATQRPDDTSLGHNPKLRSHFAVGVCFRTKKQSEIRWVLDSPQADDLDPALFRYPGLFYAQVGADTMPTPIRDYTLTDPADARRIASILAPGMTTLPDWLTATRGQKTSSPETRAEQDETHRLEGDPTMTNPSFNLASTINPAPRPGGTEPASTGSGAPAVAETLDRIRAYNAEADNDPPSDVPPIPLTELADAHHPDGEPDPEPGDRDATTAILSALALAGPDGLSRAELVDRTEVPTLTAIRLLGSLERAGRVTGEPGTGDHVRWCASNLPSQPPAVVRPAVMPGRPGDEPTG